MNKFPSIEQFRNVAKSVELTACYRGDDAEGRPIYEKTILPTLDFVGTVKLHGTNSAVSITENGFHFQSRERIITPEDDNYGFAAFGVKNIDYFQELFKVFGCKNLTVFGEWCGKGIQEGVAISELDRMFVIFKILADDEWVDFSFIGNVPERRIFNIYSFGHWTIKIDFNSPAIKSNELLEITNAVEKECPAGKYFGVSGIGEGVVWSCVSEGYKDSKFTFKVKGEKHSVTKVKTLSLVDIAKLESIKECVDAIMPENRLERGLSYLSDMGKDLDIKNISEFIKWTTSDAIKEEADIIANSGFTPKDVGKELSVKARNWFLNRLKV